MIDKIYRISYKGKTFTAKQGEILRNVLIKNGLSPHNGNSGLLNCRGTGSCGTCAVEIKCTNIRRKTFMERWRLQFPPHTKSSKLRLACQVKIESNMDVIKHQGFWGQTLKP